MNASRQSLGSRLHVWRRREKPLASSHARPLVSFLYRAPPPHSSPTNPTALHHYSAPGLLLHSSLSNGTTSLLPELVPFAKIPAAYMLSRQAGRQTQIFCRDSAVYLTRVIRRWGVAVAVVVSTVACTWWRARLPGGGSLDHTSQLQGSPIALDAVGPMADLNSSLESSGVSADDKATVSSAGCESMLWEGWHPSVEATALPELVPASSSRLSFNHQADMLSTMLSHFHTDGQTPFFQEPAESEATVSFSGMSARNVYLSGIPCPMPPKQEVPHFMYASKPSPLTWGPESPSSPLALQGWPPVSENSSYEERTKRQLELFSFADRGNHVMVPNVQSSEIHNFGWTAAAPPEAYTSLLEPGSYPRGGTTRSQQLMNFVRIAQEQQGSDPAVRGYGEVKVAGKQQHRGVEDHGPAPKRPHLQQPVDSGAALWRNASQRPQASQAMEIYAIGPALNTNGKPRARRGSATDPQSVYARHRREKINERLKTLQHLVPNGAKVDIVTMLDEAVHYVQFLQHQVKLLKSDKYWIHATPNTYKGIDLTQMQGVGPSA